MIVTSIAATGLKGFSFRHSLTALNLITGENFKGKTSRIAALQLALLGYIPGETPKKTNAAIMDFAETTRLDVAAGFESGDMTRSYYEERGVRKCEANLDPLDIPLLDAAAFFRMGPTEKLAYTFSKVKLPESYSVDGIVASIKALPVEDPNEHTEAALVEIAQKIREALEKDGINDGSAALTKQKDGIITKIIAYQKKRIDETIAFVRVASDLRTREGECSAERRTEIEAELKAAREVLAKATAKQGGLDARAKAAKDTTKRRTDLQAALAKAPRDFDTEIATKRVALNTAQQAIEEPEGLPEDRDASALDEHEENLISIASDLKTKRTEAQAAGKALAEKEAVILKQITELDELTACPHCKSKGKSWKKTLADTYTAELSTVRAELSKSREAWPSIVDAFNAADKKRGEFEAWREATTTNAAALKTAQTAITTLETLRDAAVEARRTAQAELDNLTAAEPPTEQEVEEVSREVETATETIEAIETRRTAAIELDQEIKRAAESAKEHTIASAKLRVAQAAQDKMKATQGEMIAKGIGGTIDLANSIFGDILQSPLAFHEGDIGRWKGAKFIKTATFSGAEEMLAFVAMSAALSAQAAIKLVTIDEFDRLDDSRQAAAIGRLQDAVRAGTLDQVIIASPRVPAGNIENWAHIKL